MICVNSAVSDNSGHANFSVNPGSFSTNRFAMDNKRGDELKIIVGVTSVDNFCKQRSIEYIDFMKIDVEGAEVKVILGASGMLRNHAIGMILIEICPAN